MNAFHQQNAKSGLLVLLLALGVATAKAAGGPGNALQFPLFGGPSVTITNAPALNAYPLTVTAWIKTAVFTFGGNPVPLVSKSVTEPGWQLSILSGGSIVAGYAPGFGNYVGSGTIGLTGTAVTDNQWHHVAFTVDASGGRLYRDGVLVASGNWVGAPGAVSNSFDVTLGRPVSGSVNPYEGLMDEVRIWNVALSQAQIQSNMNRSLTGAEPGLIAYYRCDESAGPTSFDSAPAGGTNNGVWNSVNATASSILPFAPYVETAGNRLIGLTNGFLGGEVNAFGTNTFVWFEWGFSTNYGNVTPAVAAGAGTNTFPFSQAITGLFPFASGQYRAVASNQFGIARGTNATFTVTNGFTVPSSVVGSGQAFATWQPVLELNYLICTNGSYPVPDGSSPPPFLGEIRLFAGNRAPAGWSFCHGEELSITNSFALFNVFGTTYGGDAVNTFALPDLRSRGSRGTGPSGPLPEVYAGEQAGASQRTLLLVQVPIHAHTLPLPYGGNSGAAGSGQPHSTDQPYLGINNLIVIGGNFPSATNGLQPFLGQMPMFAGDFAPQNYARSHGQSLPINQNQALFSLLGTTFGGNGQTAFALPDLRGRTPMAAGQGSGLSARSLGQIPGMGAVTITSGQLPAHQHALPGVPPISPVTGTIGSNQPQSLLQPSLVLRFLIATNGEQPSASIQATNRMIGEIQLYAGNNVPGGWALCEGQLLSIAANPSLFAVISNFFGGDGVTTFALPDLRGRIPVGSPTGQPGATYGAEEFTLTEAQLPPHTHSVPALSYLSWGATLGLQGAAAAFDADPDGDGEVNGLEWATGTDPTNAASSVALTITRTNQQARLHFTRNTNATDVTIHLQRVMTQTNPAGWSGFVSNVAGVWNLPGSVNETGTTNPSSVVVYDSLSNTPAAIYRLRITRP